MIERLMKLFTNPKEYWSAQVTEPGDIKTLLLPQMAILAGVPAVCQLLGTIIAFRAAIGMALVGGLISCILTYAMQIVAWIALGYIIDALASSFGAQKDLGQAMKLAAGTIMPAWIGSVLSLTSISALGIVGSLGGMGYGAYLLYLGLPIMNGTPQEKTIGYTIASIAILFVLSMVLFFLVGCPVACLMTRALLSGG